MTVAELLDRISSAELTEWMAFATLEPFGYDADFLGHAQTATVIANTHRGKHSQSYKIKDFMPKRKSKATGVQDMIAAVELANIAVGGKDERKRNGST